MAHPHRVQDLMMLDGDFAVWPRAWQAGPSQRRCSHEFANTARSEAQADQRATVRIAPLQTTHSLIRLRFTLWSSTRTHGSHK